LGEEVGRKNKPFTANRPFLVGSGSYTVESKRLVAAGHDDNRKASFGSGYEAVACGVELQ
jgi:hypothetical protein